MSFEKLDIYSNTEKKSHIASWIVIVMFGLSSLFLVGIAWWWFFFHSPTAPPKNLKLYYSGRESSDRYIYSFSWENGDKWPVMYSYELKNSDGGVVSSGSTSKTSWNSPALENGIYTFAISSKASTWLSSKSPSGNIVIELTVLNPTKYVGEMEVFAVMGRSSTGQEEYFSTSENAAQVCETIGATLATDIQLAEAFNDGADWWAYTWYENTITPNIESGYPCWNNSEACTSRNVTKAQIVDGYATTSGGTPIAGVTCWGIKPSENQEINVPTSLVDNPAAVSFLASSFSSCQGRYYQRNVPSQNVCVCDVNSCSA